MPNTTVTITYANGATREFVASDELEKSINEGEMFSVTTMHSDMSIDEEMSVSKMYVGNPISAMGNMMIMKRNAENLVAGDQIIEQDELDKLDTAIQTLNACIVFMSDEISSHQSGMSPEKGVSPDFKSVKIPVDRMYCHVINNMCRYYTCQLDENDDIAIEHCTHPDNSSNTEGNCEITLCPLCNTKDDHCEHGKKLNDYCQPCGRVNGCS